MDTKVTLVDWPRYPLETLYTIWQAGRTTGPLESPEEVHLRGKSDEEFRGKMRAQCAIILGSHLPVIESLYFTFVLENMSISLREQLVRHRIGTRVGPSVGVDVVPDLATSTWWSQSMRVLDMSRFATEGHYRVPEGLEGKAVRTADGMEQPADERFHDLMLLIQTVYKELCEAGVKNEDAREVLPMAVQHRTSWTLSLASIYHIVGKRSCWILQADLWFPVIKGIIHELAEKVDPYFLEMANPPCIKQGVYGGCVHKAEVHERIIGRDQLPPCALYMGNELDKEQYQKAWDNIGSRGQLPEFNRLSAKYAGLWKRDPNSGNPW